MKITLIVILSYLLGGRSEYVYTQQNSELRLSKFKSLVAEGLYSLHDTSSLNDGRKSFECYKYIYHLIFSGDGNYFVQSPHTSYLDSNAIAKFKNTKQRVDYGNYTLSGDSIVLEGVFTFFARGYDWRQYEARYKGYFSENMDTLFLKISCPLPPIKMKFNKTVKRQLEGGAYEIYTHKKLSRKVSIDLNSLFNYIK